jgi:hypothetical protein
MNDEVLGDIDRSKALGATALVFLGTLSAVTALGELFLAHEKTELEAVVNASNPEIGENVTVSVNTDPDLGFGTVPAGATASKTLDLNTSNPTRVTVTVTGNISRAIPTPHPMFFEDRTRIEVEATPPKPNMYTGTVKIKTARSKGPASRQWIKLQRSLASSLS